VPHHSLLNFIFAKTTQISVIFLRFQIFEKWTNLRLPVNVQKLKVFQLQGGSPDPLTRGSAPGPRWGLRPQTPVIGLRTALAMGPCLPPSPKKIHARTAAASSHVLLNSCNNSSTCWRRDLIACKINYFCKCFKQLHDRALLVW